MRCPLCMMYPEEEIKDDTRQESIRSYLKLSSSTNEVPGSVDSKKRKIKINERSSSQPPSKSRRNVDFEEGNENPNNLLHQLLEKFKGLELKVNNINTIVSELKHEVLMREVPVNTELKLDQLITDVKEIKSHLDQAPNNIEMSTQAVLEAITTDMEGAPNTSEEPQQLVKIRPEDVIADWQDYLKKRKLGYNKHISNKGRYEIQMGWKNMNPPFVPAEYLPKEINEAKNRRRREPNDFAKRAHNYGLHGINSN